MQAYRQGEFESFSAIYAIINSVRLAAKPYHSFTFNESCAFYQAMIQYLYDTNQLMEIIKNGTSFPLMRKLLEAARLYLLNTHGLKLFHKLPLKYRNYPIKNFASYIGRYVTKKGNSCLVRMHNKEVGDHWSVICKKALSHKLKLFDSCAYPELDINKASWGGIKSDDSTSLSQEGIILIKICQ